MAQPLAPIYHIVAVQPDGGIGFNGDLLHDSPDDRRFFKQTTTGHVVLMYRKTWESLPAAGLPGRYVVVVGHQSLTRQPDYYTPTLDDALQHASEVAEGRGKVIFVAGGAAAYRDTAHLIAGAYVTRFTKNVEADTFYCGVPDRLAPIRSATADELNPTQNTGPDYVFTEWAASVPGE